MSSRKSSARSRKSALSSRANSRLEGENTPADTNEAEAEQEPVENKDQESRISDAVEEWDWSGIYSFNYSFRAIQAEFSRAT